MTPVEIAHALLAARKGSVRCKDDRHTWVCAMLQEAARKARE